MDSVNLMKLSKIIKNRKAMTPVMIGVIVAASVIAVLFIVMAAVIPVIKSDVDIFVNPVSIKSNSTTDQSLRFKVTCDHQDGTIYKVEIYKGETMYAAADTDEPILNREVKEITIPGFVATEYAPASEIGSGGYLVFQHDAEYKMIIYFEDSDGSYQSTSSTTWTFVSYNA